jgi:hypothetical protein
MGSAASAPCVNTTDAPLVPGRDSNARRFPWSRSAYAMPSRYPKKFGPAVHVGHDPPAETRCQAHGMCRSGLLRETEGSLERAAHPFRAMAGRARRHGSPQRYADDVPQSRTRRAVPALMHATELPKPFPRDGFQPPVMRSPASPSPSGSMNAASARAETHLPPSSVARVVISAHVAKAQRGESFIFGPGRPGRCC